ncbi:hypothetical protein O9929_11200 [Vibrio lentus]|nr:hypothetical protein [Vibrio lentus]
MISYKKRLKNLLDDLYGFFKQLGSVKAQYRCCPRTRTRSRYAW